MTARRDLILSAPRAGERPLRDLPIGALVLARARALEAIHFARLANDDAARVDGLLTLMRVRAEYAQRVQQSNRRAAS